MRLAPRFLGASVFAPAPATPAVGAAISYSDARAQLAKLYALSKSYPGSDPESTVAAITNALAAFKFDVDYFTPWDSAFVEKSTSWANLFANAPTLDPSGVHTWPVESAQAFNDAAFSLQTLVPTVAKSAPPARTAIPVVTAIRPTVVAAAANPMPSAAPVTVIVQTPTKAKFPWSFVFLGAGAAYVGYLVLEKHGRRRR